MKKLLILFLTILMCGCSNGNNSVGSLNKDEYGAVYSEVAQVLYTYNKEEPSGVKRQMNEIDSDGDLWSVAVMIKMFSEVYLSDKFDADPTNTITVKGYYEDAEMIFDVHSKYEDGYIFGSIRSFSEVFAPEESFNFIRVKYDFENEKIISFDSYADYCEDGIEYAHFENNVMTKLDLKVIDEEYTSINNFIQTTKENFINDIENSTRLDKDFSTEIANVIEYVPW